MNLSEWRDEVNRRIVRRNHRNVVWMTRAEVNEISDLVWGEGRRSYLPLAFHGIPIVVIDEAPEGVPYCPICARCDNACVVSRSVIRSRTLHVCLRMKPVEAT